MSFECCLLWQTVLFQALSGPKLSIKSLGIGQSARLITKFYSQNSFSSDVGVSKRGGKEEERAETAVNWHKVFLGEKLKVG